MGKRKGEKAASRANHDTFGIRFTGLDGAARIRPTKYVNIAMHNQVFNL